MRRPSVSITVCTLVLLLSVGVAHAAAPCEGLDAAAAQRYQALAAAGSEHVAAARYDEALAAFTEAQGICPFDPSLVYNLARTHHLAGDCKTAITLYAQAQTQLAAGLVQTSLDPDKLAQRLAEAEAQCSQPTLTVTCAEAGVALTVGGDALPCPFSGPMAPGTYQVRAERSGAEPYEATLVVEPATSAALVIPALVAVPEVAPPGDSSGSGLWGWVGLGGGGLLVATGVVLHLVAEGDRDTVRQANVDEAGFVDGMTEAEALELQDGANTLDTVGAVTIGVGVAAMAAGVVWWLVGGDEDGDVAANAAFTVGSDNVMLNLWGRF